MYSVEYSLYKCTVHCAVYTVYSIPPKHLTNLRNTSMWHWVGLYSSPGGSLHALRYLVNIRYDISWLIFVIRYLHAVVRYWNDWRSRSAVFLCFYSAIFKLTSVKFQTFCLLLENGYRSIYIKFWQQLRIISYMFVPNFKKRVKFGKNFFPKVISLKIPFHPNQSTFGSFFCFLSFFSS